MKVLDLNLVLLKFLGLYTDETSIPLLQTIRFVFFLLGVTFSASVCSGIYLYYHFRELEMATNALIVLTAGMAGSTSFITFAVKLKEIKELYRTLQPIVNTGETLIFWKSRSSCVLLPSNERFHFIFASIEANGSAASHFYQDAERKSRRDVKYLTGFMLGNITLGGYTAVFINALHQIFFLKNYDASEWFLPYKTM